jgi:hypothetical protein
MAAPGIAVGYLVRTFETDVRASTLKWASIAYQG